MKVLPSINAQPTLLMAQIVALISSPTAAFAAALWRFNMQRKGLSAGDREIWNPGVGCTGWQRFGRDRKHLPMLVV